MPILLDWKEIKAQSDSVFAQFGERWKKFAKVNAGLPQKNCRELSNIGIGKVLVLVGMGSGLERDIEVLKKYRDKVDIMVCDKGFKQLLDHGIKADYVMLCDTNILINHIGDAINETKGVKLLSTPYSNIMWTAKWQGDRYFFINKDSIQSERIFSKIMLPDTRIIPAGSNVSNAMLIFATGADENINLNFMGYERYLLVGYDYSWKPNNNYYAFKNPKPKRYYMNHRTMLDINFDMVFTSENLFFSAKWLISYITTFRLPVFNCTGQGLLDIPLKDKLENQLKSIRPEKASKVKEFFNMLKQSYKVYKKAEMQFEESRRGIMS